MQNQVENIHSRVDYTNLIQFQLEITKPFPVYSNCHVFYPRFVKILTRQSILLSVPAFFKFFPPVSVYPFSIRAQSF